MQSEGGVTDAEALSKPERYIGIVVRVIYKRSNDHAVWYAREGWRLDRTKCSDWYRMSVGDTANDVIQTLADQVIRDVLSRGLMPCDFRVSISARTTVNQMFDTLRVTDVTVYELSDFYR